MRKSLLSIILIFTIALTANSQSEVAFNIVEEPGKLIWVCKNNGNVRKEVTFTLKSPKGLRGYSRPITKLVSAGAEVAFLTVTYKGKYSYAGTNWKTQDKPTEEERTLMEAQKSEKYIETFGDLSKGIVVFEKEGCPRCQRSIAYLLDNNYDFKLISTDKGTLGNKKMWELLRANGYSKTINMPVILVDGELTADHEDLMAFLKGLPKPEGKGGADN